MKYLLILLLALPVFAAATDATSPLASRVLFVQDSSINLRIEYEGGIENWDAAASMVDGILLLSNSMFLTVLDESGTALKPRAGKILSVQADSYFRDPFSVDVDISEIFDLSLPGDYRVVWGSAGVAKRELAIAIVNAG